MLARVRETWRWSNGWTRAGFLCLMLYVSCYLVISHAHEHSPGDYNSPEKVKVRKALWSLQGAGSVLMCVGLWAALRRQEREGGS